MKRALASSLLLGCVLWLGAVAQADDRAGSRVAPPAGDETKQRWSEAKASLRRGAYRDALESFDLLLSVSPNDPWAQLYRSLCELRLKSAPTFHQLTQPELRSLTERLRLEERSQRRTSVQQKAIEHQIHREQAKWDRELGALSRQAARDKKVEQQRAQAEAVQRARAERATSRALAQEEALRQSAQPPAQAPTIEAAGAPPPRAEDTGAATPVTQPAEPSVSPERAPEQALASAPSTMPSGEAPRGVAGPERSVELQKVIVPTPAADVPAGKTVTTPSLAGRQKPPPGAVQINAQQMSVSPDRKIAYAQGDVEVIFENAVLTCDFLTLFTDTKDAYAEGRVRLEEGNQVFRGEMAHYNFETHKGRFLQGTISSPPWHEHGRSVEHIAEGVYQVTPGYVTSCELEPPHFKFSGRRATVFADDKLARARNVALVVEQVPFFYLPWLSVADRQTPFFLIPGKRKPWGHFALMGYRYELPGPASQKGTIKVDWRRYFGWAVGADHQFDSERLGKGLLKLYYNEERNHTRAVSDLPKGAQFDRYRVLWRHNWQPMPGTTVITDIQKFSDVDFRQELLFQEEFSKDNTPETFVSVVTNDPNFTFTGLVRRRINRFQTVDNALPQVTFDVRPQQISDTHFFSQTKFDVANFETKRAHSDNDSDVIRGDWFQQLSYALNWFRPIQITPRAAVRQTYYTKDIQGGSERTDGDRDVLSGQFSMGGDSSLKLFRVFPVKTNAFGLDINWLRHVLTPTVTYDYIHRPTVSNSLLNFATAGGATNQITFGVENKLQTKRARGKERPRSVDLARLVTSLPYTFRGNGNKQGGRYGEWAFDLELYPWPWMRLESDWNVPSHFVAGTRDDRVQRWNLDLVIVGGPKQPEAQQAPGIQAPVFQAFEPGPRSGITMMPQGEWYLGLGHRYSQNDKTEDVLQLDWRLSEKWQVGAFHRMTWKEVSGTSKRFANLREYQYTLRRDLHDWIGELVYRVDREYGEELFFTLTLKAYPELPIELEDSYHQPKIGSQSSPFSPIRR